MLLNESWHVLSWSLCFTAVCLCNVFCIPVLFYLQQISIVNKDTANRARAANRGLCNSTLWIISMSKPWSVLKETWCLSHGFASSFICSIGAFKTSAAQKWNVTYSRVVFIALIIPIVHCPIRTQICLSLIAMSWQWSIISYSLGNALWIPMNNVTQGRLWITFDILVCLIILFVINWSFK